MYVSGIQCISGWWAHGTHYYIVYPEYASLLYYTVHSSELFLYYSYSYTYSWVLGFKNTSKTQSNITFYYILKALAKKNFYLYYKVLFRF